METIVTEGRLTEEAHRVVAERVGPGDRVVDATAGNGHDSVFLAGLVGDAGTVCCFDVQEAACRETERRLREVEAGREVHCCGHERMGELVAGRVKAVMFNLGYLPGSDHEVTTVPESSVAGLQAALGLLEPGGVVTVLCYVGHAGGAEEAKAVRDFCEGLEAERFRVTRTVSGAPAEAAPFLIAIEKVDR